MERFNGMVAPAPDTGGLVKYSEAMQEIIALGLTVGKQDAEIEKLKNDIKTMVEKAADENLEGYRELGGQLAERDKKIDSLRHQVQGLATQLDKQYGTPCEIMRHQEEIESFREQVKELTTTITECGFGRAEKEIESLLGMLEAETSHCAVILRQRDAHFGDLSQAREEIESMTSQIDLHLTQIEQRDIRIESLAADLLAAEGQNLELEQEIESLSNKLIDAQSLMREFQISDSKHVKEIESLRSKIKMRDLEIEYEQGEHYEWKRRARDLYEGKIGVMKVDWFEEAE